MSNTETELLFKAIHREEKQTDKDKMQGEPRDRDRQEGRVNENNKALGERMRYYRKRLEVQDIQIDR